MNESKKVVFITGGATGIGKGCVLKFLEQGYCVATMGRNLNKLEEMAKEASSEDLIYFQGDVSNQNQIISMIDKIVDRFGRLDAVINNAGICTSIPFIAVSYT